METVAGRMKTVEAKTADPYEPADYYEYDGKVW